MKEIKETLEKIRQSLHGDSKEPHCVSDCIGNINAYLFKYKDEAQKKYPGITDDKAHLGIMAQELEENPLTKACVDELDDGTKVVDTRQVALTDMALITDLAKRVAELEQKIGR